MSLSKKLAALRKKPRNVRERILLVSMVIIAAILAVVWYLSYKIEPIDFSKGFARDVMDGLSKSFNDPVYDDTFKTPSIDELQNGPEADMAQ